MTSHVLMRALVRTSATFAAPGATSFAQAGEVLHRRQLRGNQSVCVCFRAAVAATSSARPVKGRCLRRFERLPQAARECAGEPSTTRQRCRDEFRHRPDMLQDDPQRTGVPNVEHALTRSRGLIIR